MIPIICKLGENQNVGLSQPSGKGDISIYHLNDEGEFIGVGEISSRELAQIIQDLLPYDKRNMWR